MKTTWTTGLLGLILLIGCAGKNGDITETVYNGGQVTQAVVKENKNNMYTTVSGDPVEAINGGLTTEDQLPYGGGQAGMRTVDDEVAPIGF